MKRACRGWSGMPTASIVITRASSSDANTYNLRITDDMSGALVCEVNMTGDQFAAAFTAQHVAGVDITWYGVDRIGKKREVKTEIVTVPPGPLASREKRTVAAVAAHEVDGWTARGSDAMNHHRARGSTATGDRYEVTFTRFVDPE